LDEFSIWAKEFADSEEFLNLLKSGIFGSEITVFIKKGGKIMKIPDGATVLDLAYYLGAEKGNKCSGAIIDGKIASIDRKLFNNETIDLLTSTDAKPSIEWLSIVKTPKAKSAVKKRLRQMENDEKANRAFNLLLSAYDYVNESISFEEYKIQILKYFVLKEESELFEKIYSGEITTDDILEFTKSRTNEADLGKFAHWIVGKKKQHKLLIDSLKNSNQIRPAVCCNPLVGDKIVGFRTNGDRGISIHRANCENALIFADDADKVIYCDWSEGGDFGIFYEEISILGVEKDNFFPDVIGAFRKMNIKSESMTYRKGKGIVKMLMWVKVKNTAELDLLVKELKKVKEVKHIYRNLPPKEII
jgi:GTP pyrophosphokinase